MIEKRKGRNEKKIEMEVKEGSKRGSGNRRIIKIVIEG